MELSSKELESNLYVDNEFFVYKDKRTKLFHILITDLKYANKLIKILKNLGYMEKPVEDYLSNSLDRNDLIDNPIILRIYSNSDYIMIVDKKHFSEESLYSYMCSFLVYCNNNK